MFTPFIFLLTGLMCACAAVTSTEIHFVYEKAGKIEYLYSVVATCFYLLAATGISISFLLMFH